MGSAFFQTLRKILGNHWDQLVMGSLVFILAGMMTYLLWPQPQYELTLTPLPDTSVSSAEASEASGLAMSMVDSANNPETNDAEGGNAHKVHAKPRFHHKPKKPKIVLKPGSLSLNTATVSQLDLLPGVGPKMAQRILAYRKEHGAFATVDDLQNVKGIGPKNFAKIKPFLKI